MRTGSCQAFPKKKSLSSRSFVATFLLTGPLSEWGCVSHRRFLGNMNRNAPDGTNPIEVALRPNVFDLDNVGTFLRLHQRLKLRQRVLS
jgi:hypothetical protein